jgi:signal transduction histidine kinase
MWASRCVGDWNSTPQGPAVEIAMQELVREFQDRGEIQVDLHAEADGLSSRDGLGFEVLQIVREGLTNIVRHAAATKASVLVESRNGTVEVVIRDDGRGFPAASESGAEDLPATVAPWSIRERVASLGGSLRLKSVVGRGSEIRITLPRAGA